MSDGEVSFRPMSLRPGGAAGLNPFSSFGKGAGIGLVRKVWPGISAQGCVPPPYQCLWVWPDFGLPSLYSCLLRGLQVTESSQFREERKKKPPGEIIQYTREFLMKFSEVLQL